MHDEDLVEAIADGVVASVEPVSARVRAPVAAVSLEIYPWHSYLAMSILDAATPGDRAESPAEWHLFEAASSFDSGTDAFIVDEWQVAAAALNARWAAAAARGDANEVTAHLHRLAARALTSAAVADAFDAVGWGAAERQVINVDDPARHNYAAD